MGARASSSIQISAARRAANAPSTEALIKNNIARVAYIFLAVCLTAVAASAQQPVNLRSAANFAVLGGTAVTFTGAGSVTGNVGISPLAGPIVLGTPPVTVNGTVYTADAVAAQAQADLDAAITDAAGRVAPLPITVSGDIGGQTLTPGLYFAASSLAVSSTNLTLDGQGNPNAVFIFQIGSTFTVANGLQVVLINRAKAANIFWQVGTSATLGTTSVVQGTILASASITLDTGATLNGRALAKAAVTVDTGGGSSASIPSGALRFIPVQPCRVADTRSANGPFAGPFLAAGTSRDFAISSSACGIPTSAEAYSINVTVVPIVTLGYLQVWPSGQPEPTTSTLNSFNGNTKADAVIVGAGTGGAISVFATDNTHLVIDINGYFVDASNTSALAFYTLTPCRVADTRTGSPLFGGQIRTFTVLSGLCTVPPAAQAYSMNVTVIPRGGGLGFLTTWPAGQPQPLASILNAWDGDTTANAAIVQAGTLGNIDFFASSDTDLVIDINGYFAPQATGALSFYNPPPCRAMDTRQPVGSEPFNGALNASVAGPTCNLPTTAQSLVVNTTILPTGYFGYLALWPPSQPQPLVSTLNAVDGAINSNMAIVGTTNGAFSVFATNPTYLVVDVLGYMAP